MEDRLKQPALPSVIAKGTAQQAVAGHFSHPVVQHAALVEYLVVDQHLPSQFWIAHQGRPLWPQQHFDHGPVAGRGTQERGRITH